MLRLKLNHIVKTMNVNLPLQSMSIEEKVQAMESLWNDLCEHAESIESPVWHEDILADREQALQNNSEQFVDWDTAKKEINKKL